MSDPHNAVTVVERTDVARLHPLVKSGMEALALAPDAGMMRELLAVQREWEAGEARKSYTRAVVELKRDMPTVIARDAVVDFTSAKGRTYYTHVSLAGVMDAITEPLTRHGFSLGYDVVTANNLVTVTAILTHSDGHAERVTITAPPDTMGSKGPAQAIMSTITLLKRYTATTILGIATADMKEPEGERQDDDAVDPDRNLRAMGKMLTLGKTRTDAEAFAGRKVEQWTIGDLRRLQAWAKPRNEGGE